MGIQLESLGAEALKLTSRERTAFAQVPLSLDEDAELENDWVSEVERRVAVIESIAVRVAASSSFQRMAHECAAFAFEH